jgi:hypothetical protein
MSEIPNKLTLIKANELGDLALVDWENYSNVLIPAIDKNCLLVLSQVIQKYNQHEELVKENESLQRDVKYLFQKFQDVVAKAEGNDE